MPFQWNDVRSGIHDMEFLAGFIGFTQAEESLTLRPKIGWAVREAVAAS